MARRRKPVGSQKRCSVGFLLGLHLVASAESVRHGDFIGVLDIAARWDTHRDACNSHVMTAQRRR